MPRYSRSTADHDAAHSVGETVRKQAGDIIVHDLHLTALELSDLIQADLVLLGVLEDGGGGGGEKEGEAVEMSRDRR